MSCNCTHRRILPDITPRNAGGISPRAGSRENPSHFLSERPERKCAKKESPTPLYRPVITPQHLWLECYFFFVSSNKEKVTKTACPEQGQGETFLLSFSAMRKKVSKERIADTALSANSYSIPMMLTLILYFLLASLTIWLFHHHILC